VKTANHKVVRHSLA